MGLCDERGTPAARELGGRVDGDGEVLGSRLSRLGTICGFEGEGKVAGFCDRAAEICDIDR